MSEPFWISTGDISEEYVPLRIVMNYEGIDRPAFKGIDHRAAYDRAVAALVDQAQKAGGNGVVWISFAPTQLSGTGGFMLFASGTAVRVVPKQR